MTDQLQAIGYARISTEEQSTNSIPGQCSEITAYCTRNNLHLHKIFIEDGQSAFNFNRTEWKELEAYLRNNKSIKYLVIHAIDRFSRANLVDALQKMDEIQKKVNVKILTVTDPVNLDTEDFGVDLRRIMELMFSNYELKKIRKRTTDGIYHAMAAGKFINKAPFGYINARDLNNKPVLVIDEEKAYLVRMIFRSYLQGMEIEEIRRHVKANGFKMKGNSVMRVILSNPTYASLIKLPKYGHNQARIVKALHTPIVSESDYWSVQERLNRKTIAVHKREEVFMRGVIHCWCGRKMTAGKSKGRKEYYWYYLCKTHPKNIAAKKLHEQMIQIIELLSLPHESIQRISDKFRAMIDEKLGNRGGDLMKANINLKKVQDKIDATQEKFLVQADISPAVYNRVITSLRADESILQMQVAELNTTTRDYYSIMNELLPKLSNLKEMFIGWPLFKQQSFLNIVFDHSLFYKDGISRTAYVHPIFTHNLQILKEKGLLIVEQSDVFSGVTPGRAPERS